MSEQGQQLLTEAIGKFSTGDKQAGMALLQKAAESGNVRAAMFYADCLFKENKNQAYIYLSELANKGIVGALHRKVLLQIFFDSRNVNKQNFRDLHQDALAGDIQSLLVLINMFHRNKARDHYISVLHNIDPNICEDLALINETQVAPPTSEALDELAALFVNEFNRLLVPDVTLVAEEIKLTLAKAALTELECRYLQLRYGGMLKPSYVVDPLSGQPIRDPHRTGSMATIGPELLDWTMLAIEWRMENISGISRTFGEPTNLIHYNSGQEYKAHYDAIVGQATAQDHTLLKYGQRQKTILCYLNTVPEGGATVFPKLNISCHARMGDMLMFDNVDLQGQVLVASYHCGQPVVRGEKWILSKWIRQFVTDYGTLTYR